MSGTGASITVLAANSRRRGATIFNDSGVSVDLDVSGGTASATSCTLTLFDQDYYEVPFGHRGAITGIWASGAVRVTEFE